MGITSIICTSCMSPVMSQQSFDGIGVGSMITQVKEQVGEPYEIEKLDNGVEVYHYIERIEIGSNTTAQNTYLLTVSKGRVVDKRCLSTSNPLIKFRSP